MGAWILFVLWTPIGWANGKAVVPVQLPAAGARVLPLAPAALPADPRGVALASLADAGLPQLLRSEGLVLWKINAWTPRSGGPRAELTLSLPHDGRPFDRRQADPAREGELRRRVEGARSRVTALAGAALGIAPEDVTTDERLIETCCGMGCGACVLMKPRHAELWTGREARTSSR
ncbi:MAG: hypothetical protein HY553_19445 [Elusimicrobia bacterium]|nr:hypothetical protein [Elusimicrobiota bacterium]